MTPKGAYFSQILRLFGKSGRYCPLYYVCGKKILHNLRIPAGQTADSRDLDHIAASIIPRLKEVENHRWPSHPRAITPRPFNGASILAQSVGTDFSRLAGPLWKICQEPRLWKTPQPTQNTTKIFFQNLGVNYFDLPYWYQDWKRPVARTGLFFWPGRQPIT